MRGVLGSRLEGEEGAGGGKGRGRCQQAGGREQWV